MNHVTRLGFVLLLASLVSISVSAAAQTGISLDPYVTAGLSGPIDIAVPNDGSQRMFVAEQGGAIKVVDMTSGSVIGTWLNVAVTASGEQGLMAIELDPNFGIDPGKPGYGDVYVAFTAPANAPQLGTDPDQVLRRYRLTSPASNDASGASGADVLRIPDHARNHNGADLHFGADGYLYYSMGDGGDGGDSHNHAQNNGRKTEQGRVYYLLGKLLRLDVHHTTSAASADMCAATAGQPAEYTIPAGNPFKGSSTDCGEIWLWGLRNPFRFSFDRQSGDLWIGDVGQSAWEEVDRLPAGPVANRNLGWHLCEGNAYYEAPGNGNNCPAATNTLAPVLVLGHGDGNCSVIGGYRYRGPVTALRGKYVYSDWCNGAMRVASWNGSSWTASTLPGINISNMVAFGEDTAGNLYVVGQSDHKIYRFNGSDVIFANGFEAAL